MSVGVLIVDDEPLACLGISARLEKYPDMQVLGECHSGGDALRAIDQFSPDLLFLDVEMPELSGLELLRALPSGKVPCVVFLTAHEKHAIEAFSVEALDYLLKPINNERLAACLDRVRRSLALRRTAALALPAGAMIEEARTKDWLQQFAIRRGEDVTIVASADIDWIEGHSDYAGLHVGKRTHLVRTTLSSLVSRLDPKRFLRVHRSAIIQIERIKGFKALTNRDALLTLRGGVTLRVSRSYAPAVQRILRNH